MTEIRCLYGTSVAEILLTGMENNEDIEAIGLSVLWKDGTVSAGCSRTAKGNSVQLVTAMETSQDAALQTGAGAGRRIAMEVLDQ